MDELARAVVLYHTRTWVKGVEDRWPLICPDKRDLRSMIIPCQSIATAVADSSATTSTFLIGNYSAAQ